MQNYYLDTVSFLVSLPISTKQKKYINVWSVYAKKTLVIANKQLLPTTT